MSPTRRHISEAAQPKGPVNGGAAYTPERKPNRGVLIGLCATAGVLVVAAIVVGVVLLTSGSSSSSGSRYQAEVGRIFGPVLTSNQQVSDELGRLHGARATDARAAVRRAQREVTTAQGRARRSRCAGWVAVGKQRRA